MEITLKRLYCKETYTIGNIDIDGKFLCNSIEDKVRDYNKDGDLDDNGEEKIYGKTAIPYGKYKIIVTMSPKFGRFMPLLLDVKHFSGIRIHGVKKGYIATAKNTEGCIIPGINTVKGGLSQSNEYENKITELIQKSYDKGEPVYITIK